MSLTAALSSSVAALAAFQAQTRLLSANVGNAQNENYTRKVATLTTPAIDGQPGAPLISAVVRVAAPDVLQDQLAALADFGQLETQVTLTKDLADILDATNATGEQPELVALLSRFEDALKALEGSPENGASAQDVILRAVDLASKINQLNARQTDLRTRADETVEASVTTINQAAVEIQKLNVTIASAIGSNQPIGDFEDLRDQQVKRIAEIVGVRTFTNDRGEMSVYTQGGVQLTGTVAQQFTYTRSSTTAQGTITYQGSATSLNNGFLAGRIRGALDYLDPTTAAVQSSDPNLGALAKMINQLDAFASNLVSIVNTAYAGAEARIPAPVPAEGTDFFEAIAAGSVGDEAQVIRVNPALTSSPTTESLKVLAAGDIQQALRNSLIVNTSINRSGTVDAAGSDQANGLQIGNVDLFGLANGIMAYHARTADLNTVNRDSAERVEHTLDQKYRNITGVDIDTELASLQVLQNNYAAMANVLNSITAMFDQLVAIGR